MKRFTKGETSVTELMGRKKEEKSKKKKKKEEKEEKEKEAQGTHL